MEVSVRHFNQLRLEQPYFGVDEASHAVTNPAFFSIDERIGMDGFLDDEGPPKVSEGAQIIRDA